MSLRVVVAARESAGVQAIQAVVREGHTLVAVLASAAGDRGAGAAIGRLAGRLGVPVWPADRVRDPAFGELVREARVDLLLNMHSLYVVTPEVLEAPRIGAFNLHPGPLPRYAGLNAPSWALYRGEAWHGVTLHWMEPRVDAGPIAYERPVRVEEGDTGLSLTLKCVHTGLPLVAALLRTASTDPAAIPRQAQDLSQRRYFGAAPPNDGWLSWDRPAREVVNLVRASDYRPWASPWGHPRTRAGELQIRVASAHATGRASQATPGTVDRSPDGVVAVACADEWVVVRDVVVDGRSVRAAHVLSAGARLQTGPPGALAGPVGVPA